ncbi:MAG: outer membrane protein [Saprospiraceae bacterium]|jgi:outer membrane protein
MKFSNNHLMIVLITLVSITMVGTILSYLNTPKIGYVQINEVYNEFRLKKELEGKLSTVQIARKGILDSLGMKIEMLSRELTTKKDVSKRSKLDNLKHEYLLKEQKLAEDNELLTGQYQEQIWNQLNQYTKEYSNKHDYDLLLGANGSGTLLGAKETIDATEDLIKFVNNRYEGK